MRCNEPSISATQILQDIRFSNIPSFASLAPAYIMPTTATISFQGKEFGKLTLPMIDLSHPEDGVKWANNTLCMCWRVLLMARELASTCVFKPRSAILPDIANLFHKISSCKVFFCE
jgi:hypothetical protein